MESKIKEQMEDTINNLTNCGWNSNSMNPPCHMNPKLNCHICNYYKPTNN